MASSSKVTLKLLIVKNGHKVLFAEAGKDFIDFLFSLLSLPIGTINQILDKKNKLGCLQNLHRSIENLNEDYLQPDMSKELLLKPKSCLSSSISPQFRLLLLEEAPPAASTPTASTCRYLSPRHRSTSTCPYCDSVESSTYDVSGKLVPDAIRVPGGFVKGEASYLVMDDLQVTPMSIMSSIALFKKYDAKKLEEALEEKVVEVGLDEGVELLKYALSSSTVLTNVFLGEVSEKEEIDI